jgi:hypothetical protein
MADSRAEHRAKGNSSRNLWQLLIARELVHKRPIRTHDEILGKRSYRSPASVVIHRDDDPDVLLPREVPDCLNLHPVRNSVLPRDFLHFTVSDQLGEFRVGRIEEPPKLRINQDVSDIIVHANLMFHAHGVEGRIWGAAGLSLSGGGTDMRARCSNKSESMFPHRRMFRRPFCGAMKRLVAALKQRRQGPADDTTHVPIPVSFSAQVVDYFFEYYGPTNRACGTLNEAGKKAFHEELTSLWSRNNTATDATTMLPGEYIEVIGTRS